MATPCSRTVMRKNPSPIGTPSPNGVLRAARSASASRTSPMRHTIVASLPGKGDARELAHRAPPSIAADEEPRGDLLGAEIGDHPVVARLDRAQRATSANVHVRSTFGEERLGDRLGMKRKRGLRPRA